MLSGKKRVPLNYLYFTFYYLFIQSFIFTANVPENMHTPKRTHTQKTIIIITIIMHTERSKIGRKKENTLREDRGSSTMVPAALQQKTTQHHNHHTTFSAALTLTQSESHPQTPGRCL